MGIIEVGEFIELDILVFLDNRLKKPTEREKKVSAIESTIYLVRDYEKEFDKAMSDEDLVTARKVLVDLKQEFDNCPPNTPDKEKLRELLTILYAKFKAKTTTMQFDVEIQGGKKAESDTEKSTSKASKTKKPQPLPPITSQEDIWKRAKMLLDQTEQLLKEERYRDTVLKYREAKYEATGIEATLPPTLIQRYKTVFTAIQNTLEEMRRLGKHPLLTAEPTKQLFTPETTTDPWHEPQTLATSETLDKQCLLQMEKEKRVLDKLLHQNNIVAANNKLATLKAIAQQLNNKRTLAIAQEKIERIERIINKVSSFSAHNEQKLVSVKP